MTAVILMYHRIVERAEAGPWFARGTAVTPEAFSRQMEWLMRHFDVVPLRQLLEEIGPGQTCIASERPKAAITFDDGYIDVVRHALPVCESLGVVGAVFPVCGHQGAAEGRLWFDELYVILQAAFARAREDAPVKGRSLRAWVTGVTKERLQLATPQARSRLLRRLARVLDVSPSTEALYLSTRELWQLVGRGWTVGGHGVTHSRLTLLDDDALAAELRAAVSLARALDTDEPVLAYPDGAHDERVRASAIACGVLWALTVEPAVIDASTDRLAVPRFLCRGDDAIPHPALSSFGPDACRVSEADMAIPESRTNRNLSAFTPDFTRPPAGRMVPARQHDGRAQRSSPMSHPFRDPSPKRVPLPQAPLVRVVAAVRFPVVPSVARDEFIGPLREALKERYPICTKEEAVGLSIGPQGVAALPASVDWRFIDIDERWRVTLGKGFVSLDTGAYSSREDLLERFASVIDAVTEHVGPARADRVGVRYVDQILGEKLAAVTSLVRPELLGMLGSDLADDVAWGMSDYTVEAGEQRAVRARWGKLAAGSTIDPSAVPVLEVPSWLLDIDAVHTQHQTWDPASIAVDATKLADLAYRFFRWAVTDEFLRQYGGQP